MLSTTKGPVMGIQQENPFELPIWLLESSWLKFAEGEDDADLDDAEEGEPDDAEDDDSDDEDDNQDKKSSTKSSKDDDTSGLKSALRKERTERKQLEKEAKVLRKFKETQERKGKSETDNAKADAQTAADKSARLAARLQTNSVDTAIMKAIGNSKNNLQFRDLDDAISLIKRSDIEVEQDEDDPSNIDVDSDSVVKALKDLAKRKPHLLVSRSDEDDDVEDEQDDEDDEEDLPRSTRRQSTGSKVGSRGTRDNGKLKDADLRKRYPALSPTPLR